MSALRLYGIRNCDTVKKARAFLEGRGAAYEFIDFKQTPPDAALLARWADTLGWEALVNRRGTTWRKLPQAARDTIDRQSALEMMRANPSLIRRPVIEAQGLVTVGFDETALAALLG